MFYAKNTNPLKKSVLRSKYMTSLIFPRIFFFFFNFGVTYSSSNFSRIYLVPTSRANHFGDVKGKSCYEWLFSFIIIFLLFSHHLENLLNNFGTEWRFPHFSPKSRKIQTRPETAADFPILNGDSFLMLFFIATPPAMYFQ